MAAASRRLRLVGTGIRRESLLVLLLLAAVMAIFAPNFMSLGNLINVLLATAVIGVLAIGVTFVLAGGGLDLSVGSIMAVAGVAMGLASQSGLPWPVALSTGLAVGAFLGWCPIYGLPQEIVFLGQGRVLGIPAPVWIFLLTTILGQFLISRTRFGYHTLALGDNETAARVAGIAIEAMKARLYTLSGVMAALGGLLFAARVNAADPTAGIGYELLAITAAVIGGTNLFGGRGTVVGTFIGALIMGVLQNGLNLMAVQPFYQQIAIGVILVLAVWLDRVQSRERT
jgi:ribose transport system permease protein